MMVSGVNYQNYMYIGLIEEGERERERERDYIAVHSFSVASGSTCKLLISDSLRVKCGGAVGNYPPD